MPYFIYKIFPDKKVEQITHFPKFFEAKQEVKKIRETLTTADQYQVKIIFAQNEISAEMLLKEEREYQPDGDD
jgi:hypothetical protein